MRPNLALASHATARNAEFDHAILARAHYSAVAPTAFLVMMNIIHEAHYADYQKPYLRRGRASVHTSRSTQQPGNQSLR